MTENSLKLNGYKQIQSGQWQRDVVFEDVRNGRLKSKRVKLLTRTSDGRLVKNEPDGWAALAKAVMRRRP